MVEKLLFFVGFVSFLIGAKAKSQSPNEELETLFKEIGLSPSCVSKTLASCEDSIADSLLRMRVSAKLIADAFGESKSAPTNHPQNCAELLRSGDHESGIRTVYPFPCCHERPVSVYCDQTTDGGGWTVFQHREALPERENFFRNWIEYELGFGDLNGEFWLGLRNIHALASSTLMELRVDLEDFEGRQRWAKYGYFYVGSAEEKYRLELGAYSGNAGDSLKSDHHNGKPFTTKDQDNDSHKENCALVYKGGWWYGSCHKSNLNGLPHEGNHTSFADGINWHEFRGYHHSLRRTSLGIRPIF